MNAGQLRSALDVAGDALAKQSPPTVAVYSRSVRPARGILYRAMPERGAPAAPQLFGGLRGLDSAGGPLSRGVEPPEWEGVRDRLARAAAA